jgi:hypothetical protein
MCVQRPDSQAAGKSKKKLVTSNHYIMTITGSMKLDNTYSRCPNQTETSDELYVQKRERERSPWLSVLM